MNKEGVFAGPVRIELPHDRSIRLGRLETKNFSVLVLNSVEEVVLNVVVFIVRMLETLFFPQLSSDERSVEAIFNVGRSKSLVSCHQDLRDVISWSIS